MRVLSTAPVAALVVSFGIVFGLGRLVDVPPTTPPPTPSSSSAPVPVVLEPEDSHHHPHNKKQGKQQPSQGGEIGHADEDGPDG